MNDEIRQQTKAWEFAFCDFCTSDAGLLATSVFSCAWPWTFTAIGERLDFYPFTGRRYTFFILMLTLVSLYYVSETMANVMLTRTDTIDDDRRADHYEIAYMSFALIMSLSGLAVCLTITQFRIRTREQHGIRGDVVSDACCSCAFPCCVLLQMTRETELRGEEICVTIGDVDEVVVPTTTVKSEDDRL